MVNLKSASFAVIMYLHEGLTHIQSQIKPWSLIGECFTLISFFKTKDVMFSVISAVSPSESDHLLLVSTEIIHIVRPSYKHFVCMCCWYNQRSSQC